MKWFVRDFHCKHVFSANEETQILQLATDFLNRNHLSPENVKISAQKYKNLFSGMEYRVTIFYYAESELS